MVYNDIKLLGTEGDSETEIQLSSFDRGKMEGNGKV